MKHILIFLKQSAEHFNFLFLFLITIQLSCHYWTQTGNTHEYKVVSKCVRDLAVEGLST